MNEKTNDADLSATIRKVKKELTIRACKGLKIVTCEAAKGSGKLVLSKVAGFKGDLVEKGTSFLKNYIKENMAQENPTGATVGAFAEYTVRSAANGIKRTAGSLKDYLEKESTHYKRLEVIPEMEIVKHLIDEYAKDDHELGEEAFCYEGVEFAVNKVAKELSISLKHQQRTVEVKYLLNKNPISKLNDDLNTLSDDLLNRMDKLSDPALLRVDKQTLLKILNEKGETTYLVTFKKTGTLCEVNYSPEDKKEGIILKYSTQEAKENERRL